MWKTWEGDLPESVSTQRSLASYQEPIEKVQIHAFGDASGKGISAAVYKSSRKSQEQHKV
jgi:hypothetical protein